jgi:hypothetical protein
MSSVIDGLACPALAETICTGTRALSDMGVSQAMERYGLYGGSHSLERIGQRVGIYHLAHWRSEDQFRPPTNTKPQTLRELILAVALQFDNRRRWYLNSAPASCCGPP